MTGPKFITDPLMLQEYEDVIDECRTQPKKSDQREVSCPLHNGSSEPRSIAAACERLDQDRHEKRATAFTKSPLHCTTPQFTLLRYPSTDPLFSLRALGWINGVVA
jgi:hypothetical protein